MLCFVGDFHCWFEVVVHSRINFRSKEKIEPSAIMEKFELALENYAKFSFAAMIEYDCMMKAVSLYRYQRMYVEMEVRHRTLFLTLLCLPE